MDDAATSMKVMNILARSFLRPMRPAELTRVASTGLPGVNRVLTEAVTVSPSAAADAAGVTFDAVDGCGLPDPGDFFFDPGDRRDNPGDPGGGGGGDGGDPFNLDDPTDFFGP